MKPLTIHVDDIDTAGQPWDHALPREELDEMLGGELPSEFHAGGAATVKAKLTKMGRKVLGRDVETGEKKKGSGLIASVAGKKQEEDEAQEEVQDHDVSGLKVKTAVKGGKLAANHGG